MISVDWTLFLQMAQFVVLLLILNIILYRPLRSMMEKRREKIDGAQKTAKDLDVKIQEKMARYQEKLDEAKHKANGERMAMKAEASKQEAELLSSAREWASGHMDTVKKQVAKEAQDAKKSLESDVQSMAGMIAGKVLGRSL